MKRLLSLLFHRMTLVGLFLVVQIAILVTTILLFEEHVISFYTISVGLSVGVTLWIVSSNREAAYKISWMIPTMAFPIFGGLFYIAFVGNKLPKTVRQRIAAMDERMCTTLHDDFHGDRLAALDGDAGQQARYLERRAFCPVYQNTRTEYFPLGELYFTRLLEELRKAERYIFLEYFIIEEGVMWDAILKILTEKAEQGVEVRLMYDDIGCMFTLSRRYHRQLTQTTGIQVAVFNPFVPVLSLRLNDRDHRKLCVIDGKVAFTGGINLADEYINQREKFGHWKDSGILLEGAAAWSMAVMFLTLWDFSTRKETDFLTFYPDWQGDSLPMLESYVQPYTDNPLDDEPVGQTVYLNMIMRAKRYIYITTPYLILDDTTCTALCIAAKSGVDVRIITPHIPDKKLVLELTRAHYESLLLVGVRIYEYTPGFIHAKNFIVDDCYATVGSVNLDYRSLFLHFENGVWLCHDPAIRDMKGDFLSTQALCQQITLAMCRALPLWRRGLRRVLKIFAPLL